MFAVERVHEVVQRADSTLAGRLRGEFSQAIRHAVEGQALELGWERDGIVDLSPNDYLGMAELKTCAYTTVLPLRVGAILANDELIDLDALTALAIPLGLAFQIRDDLLSLQSAGGGGKDTLGDLYEGKRSLPIIHLLATSSGRDHSFLHRFLKSSRSERTPAAVEQVRDLLEQYGSLVFATLTARQFAIEASSRFDEVFATTPSTLALDFLREMIEFTVDRRF
jgi:geranylgeranyl diphosphate synthase type II